MSTLNFHFTLLFLQNFRTFIIKRYLFIDRDKRFQCPIEKKLLRRYDTSHMIVELLLLCPEINLFTSCTLARLRIMGSIYDRKRPSTIRLRSYATAFCRITSDRITVVHLRDRITVVHLRDRITVVHLRDRIRRKTVVERRKTDTPCGLCI